MTVPYRMISRDAQVALTEFSQEFDAALVLGGITPWATDLGLSRTSKAPRTVFPIPISAAGYKVRGGDEKLRQLSERSLSLVTKQWYDGVEERADVIEAPDFVGWLKEPANIAAESLRLPNVLVADVLASNPYLDFYRYEAPGGSVASTIRLFASTHPVNIYKPSLGTFDNTYTATGINKALVEYLKKYFRTLKGPNGRPLGLKLGTLLVPPAREQEALDFFERDAMIEALTNKAGSENVAAGVVKNRHYKTVNVVVGDELTGDLPSGATGSDNVLYALADGGTRFPWVVQDTGTPEEIRFDKTSDFYKNSGKVAVKFVKTVGVAAALPMGIVQITIA